MLFIMGLALSACSLFSSPAQVRGIKGFFNDNALRLEVTAILTSDEDLDQVEVMIDRGRILLLGMVSTATIKQRAVEAIHKIKGLRQIIDEIRVGPESMADYSRDAWLGHQLRAALFFDARIPSQNYHVRVVNKVVYILGTAYSREEVGYIMKHAENLPVRQVIPHIEIIPKPPGKLS